MIFTKQNHRDLIASVDQATPAQLRAALKAVLDIQAAPIPDGAGLSDDEKALLNDGFATFQHAAQNIVHNHFNSP